jgi:hypothetical protein
MTQIVCTVLACKQCIKVKGNHISNKSKQQRYGYYICRTRLYTQVVKLGCCKRDREREPAYSSGPCAVLHKETPVHEQSHIHKSNWQTENSSLFTNLQAFFMSSSVALWRNFFKPRTA